MDGVEPRQVTSNNWRGQRGVFKVVIPAKVGIQAGLGRFVIPAKAGIQCMVEVGFSCALDAGFRRHDGERKNKTAVKQPCVYLLASQRNGTLYVGVTSGLVQRVWQHKSDAVDGFTKRYGVHNLVWFETHETMDSAIAREKAIKEWKRAWKLALIEKENPAWRDLYEEII